MTSQSWLTTNEVDRPLWKHWLTVIRPDEVRHRTALLFIGGGSNERPAPQEPDRQLATTAVTTAAIRLRPDTYVAPIRRCSPPPHCDIRQYLTST